MGSDEPDLHGGVGAGDKAVDRLSVRLAGKRVSVRGLREYHFGENAESGVTEGKEQQGPAGTEESDNGDDDRLLAHCVVPVPLPALLLFQGTARHEDTREL